MGQTVARGTGGGMRPSLVAWTLAAALAASGCAAERSTYTPKPAGKEATQAAHALKLPGAWETLGSEADSVAYLTEAGGVFRVRLIEEEDIFGSGDEDAWAYQIMGDAAREMGVPFSFDAVEKRSSDDAVCYACGSFRGRRGYGMILVAMSEEGTYVGYQVESGEVTWEAQKEAEESFDQMATDFCAGSGKDVVVEDAYDLEKATSKTKAVEEGEIDASGGFTVDDVRIERVGERATAAGTVKNDTDVVAYYVRVRCDFLDEEGRVRDWNMGFAATSVGLKPGETSTFSVSVSDDRFITDARATVTKYRDTSYVRK